MPYIDLPPPNRGDRSGAVLALQAIMLFPLDPDGRAYVQDALRARLYNEILGGDDPIPIVLAPELIESIGWEGVRGKFEEFSHRLAAYGLTGVSFDPVPSENGYKLVPVVRANSIASIMDGVRKGELNTYLMQRFKECEREACIAGKTLLHALCLVDVCPEKASLTLAREAVALELASKSGGSISNINKAWEQFSSVAHLWASVIISNTATYQFPCDQERLGDFLWLSEHFRRKAASFRPLRARRDEHLVDDSVTWKLPPSVTLSGAAEFQFTELSPWIEKALAERSSRRKR